MFPNITFTDLLSLFQFYHSHRFSELPESEIKKGWEIGKTFQDRVTYPLDSFIAISVHPVLVGLDLPYIVGREGEQNSMSSQKKYGGTAKGGWQG